MESLGFDESLFFFKFLKATEQHVLHDNTFSSEKIENVISIIILKIKRIEKIQSANILMTLNPPLTLDEENQFLKNKSLDREAIALEIRNSKREIRILKNLKLKQNTPLLLKPSIVLFGYILMAKKMEKEISSSIQKNIVMMFSNGESISKGLNYYFGTDIMSKIIYPIRNYKSVSPMADIVKTLKRSLFRDLNPYQRNEIIKISLELAMSAIDRDFIDFVELGNHIDEPLTPKKLILLYKSNDQRSLASFAYMDDLNAKTKQIKLADFQKHKMCFNE